MFSKSPRGYRAASGAALAAACFASPVHAIDHHWAVGTGTWSVAADWNPSGVPGSGDNAILDYFGGTAFVITNVGTPATVSLVDSDTVTVSRQGVLGSAGDFLVGDAGGVGTLNVTTNNQFLPFPGYVTANQMHLGVASGFGAVNQSAGTVSLTTVIDLGSSHQSGSNFLAEGAYNLSGGLLSTPILYVGQGRSCVGTFNLTGGSASVANLFMGNGGDGRGVITQTNGNMNVGSLYIGGARVPDASYTYTLNGGTLAASNTWIDYYTATYDYGMGTLNYNGGTASLGYVHMYGGQILLSSGGGKVLDTTAFQWQVFTSLIDLNDNAMIVRQGATISGTVSVPTLIAEAYNGGAWNGDGITSSAAAASAGSAHRTALGYAYAQDIGVSTFFGRSVGQPNFLVRYTYAGDANLDGTVDTIDFNLLTASFSQSGRTWFNGDFDYNGTVDTIDFNLLASNFSLALPADTVGSIQVPEPGAALALAIEAFGFLLRARRRR